MSTCEKKMAPTDRPHRAARWREGEKGRAGWRRHAGSACPGLRARGRGHGAGPAGPTWAEKWGFPFSREFLMLFYLFSLGFSIQVQIKFQIQTKSNMCNNSKNIWSSA
jgi:hypothetical protein